MCLAVTISVKRLNVPKVEIAAQYCIFIIINFICLSVTVWKCDCCKFLLKNPYWSCFKRLKYLFSKVSWILWFIACPLSHFQLNNKRLLYNSLCPFVCPSMIFFASLLMDAVILICGWFSKKKIFFSRIHSKPVD